MYRSGLLKLSWVATSFGVAKKCLNKSDIYASFCKLLKKIKSKLKSEYISTVF